MNRLDRFINMKKKTDHVLGRTQNMKLEIVTHKFGNKIMDVEGNLDEIIHAMKTGGVSLMIAPTGSGKTESVYAAAKTMIEQDEECKVVIAVPIVAIAKQMAAVKEDVYEFTGNKSLDMESRIIFCSYEKVTKIWETVSGNSLKKQKIYLIIDECHNLTYQQKFREKAISSIFSFMKQGFFDSVLLMTATPDSMAILDIDRVMCFESDYYKSSMNEIEMIMVNDEIEYIRNLPMNDAMYLIRLNNMEEIEKIKKSNPMFTSITSKDKEETIYQDLVEHGRISDRGYQGILATSVIQEGISIRDYGEKLEIIFIADANTTLDDIEQFFARARRDDIHVVKRAKVILKKTKGDMKFREFSHILEYNQKVLHHFMDIAQHMALEMGKLQNLELDEIQNTDHILMHMIQGGMEALGELSCCITYDMGKLDMDEKMLFLVSYKQYQRQYNYAPMDLKRELEERFEVTVSVSEQMFASKPKMRIHKCIWDGMEDVREAVPINVSIYAALVGEQVPGTMRSLETMKILNALKSNPLYMDNVRALARAGIEGNMALTILKNSNTPRKVKEYMEAYQVVIMNQYLMMHMGEGNAIRVPHMKKSLYELQASLYEVIEKRNKTCFKINNNLIDECIKYYIDKYKVVKNPSKRMVRELLKKMYLYKDAKDDYMTASLRVNEQDIFKVITGDFE